MSYDASLFFDEDAPAPQEAVRPQTKFSPPAKSGGYEASLFFPEEEAPAPAPAPAPAAPAAAPPAPAEDGGQWEITKGFRKGVGSTPETGAAAIRAGKYILGATEQEAKSGVSETLENVGKAVGGAEEVAVPSFTDIKDVNTAFQYVAQNIGQAAGSSLAPLISGGIGAAAGTAVAPGVGTVAGGIAGAAASGIPLGIGTVFKALEDDKEIQQLVKDGKTTWKELAQASLPYGVAVGSLDVVGEAALARLAGLHNIGKEAAKDLVKEEVKKTILQQVKAGAATAAKGAAKGAASEGITEGTQQAIQEGAVAVEGGQRDLKKSAISILDNVFAGILGGGAMGGPAATFEHKGKKPGVELDGSPKTGAEDQTPGQTGTGAAHPENPVTPDASTPGGAAPGPAAQPAGAAVRETTEAPKSETPPGAPVTGAGKVTPPAPTLPPAGGVADPTLHAAISGEINPEVESDLTPEQEAWAAQNAPKPVTDPDQALALQGIAGAAEAPQAPTAAPAPSPAPEPPAAPPTMPPGGPQTAEAPTPGAVPPEPVQPPPAAAAQPAVAEAAPPAGLAPVAGEQAAEAPPAPVVTPAIAPEAAAPQTVPEAPATLEAQRDQLTNGERPVVMYPKGTKPMDPVPGMSRVTVPKVGVFDFNHRQILREEVIHAAREDRLNDILGLGPFNKADVAATGGPELVVAERTPEGVEVRAAGATPTTAPIQQAVMEAGKTPGHIVAPEPIESTLIKRAELKEKPTERPVVQPAPSVRPLQTKPTVAPAAAKVMARRRPVTRTIAELKAVAPAPAAAPAPTPAETVRADMRREITDTLSRQENQTLAASVTDEVMQDVSDIIEKHPPGTARAMIRERVSPEKLEARYAARQAEEKAAATRAEAEKTVDALRAAREEDIKVAAGLAGTVQQKSRGLNAKPEDIRTRTQHEVEQTFKRVFKAEGEGAPSFVKDTVAAIEERRPFAKGKSKKKVAINERIQRNQEEWAKWSEAREAEEAGKQAKVDREQEVAQEVERLALTPEQREERTKAAKIAADAPNNAKAQAAVGAVMTPELALADSPEQWQGAIKQMLKGYDGTLPKNVLPERAPWVNFLTYAKRKAAGEMTVSETADVMLAHDLVAKGEADQFYAYALAETSLRGGVFAERAVEDAPHMVASSDIEDAFSRTPAPERTGDTLTNAATGYTHQLEQGSAVSASALLDQSVSRKMAGPLAEGRAGNLFKVIDGAVSKELKRLVGDTPVYRVPREAVRGLVTTTGAGNVQAFYAKPSLEAAARGERGVIVVAEHLVGNDLREVLQHEMTHAAADYAYASNHLGTGKVIDALFADAKAQATALGLDGHYGFTNAREFIAEGMSNPAFQQMLAEMPVPVALQVKVQALNPGGAVSAWRVFVAQVSRIIKAVGFGRQGMTYTDAILRTFGTATRDQGAVQQWLSTFRASSLYKTPGSNLRVNGAAIGEKGAALMHKATPDEQFSEIFDSPSVQQTLEEAIEGTKVRVRYDVSTRARIFRDRFLSNTMDIRRRADILLLGLKDKGAAFKAAIDAFLSTDHARFLRQKDGDQIALELHAFIRDDPEGGKKLTELVDRSTRAGVDFTQGPMTKTNAYFNNNNPRFERQRGEYGRLRNEYEALKKTSPKAEAHADKIAGYYRKMQNELVHATLKRLITSSVEQYAIKLPGGKTIDDAIQWVKSGDIDRTGQAQMPDDKAYHKAFGEMIGTLQGTTSVREARGLYAPLMRRGNYAVVANKDFTEFLPWVPESQQQPGENYLPKGATARNANELVFTNRNDYEVYAKDTNDQWAGDPKISTKGGQFTAFVPVQNHYLSFFEKQFEAEAKRQEMIDQGHYKEEKRDAQGTVTQRAEVSRVQHRESRSQDQFESELLPAHVKALLNSMNQNGIKDGMYELVKKGIVQTQIQSMSGNRAQHRRLKREFTHGNATDMVKAMRDYNMGASGYLATIEQMPTIQRGFDELEAFIKTHPADANVMRMQEMLNEVKRRVNDPGDYRNHSLLRTFTNLSYLNHLFSPAFLAMQYSQPIYSTMPALAGEHGIGGTMREMFDAQRRMGAGATYAKGITELGKAARGKETTDPTQQLMDRKELTDLDKGVLKRMIQVGLMDPEGVQEEALSRLDANPLDRAMAPVNRILQHVAGSIEAVNRAVTGMAAAKLHLDKHPGDIEGAIQHGVYMTEQTQYGYGKSNAPPIFQHPAGRVALQFKKYAWGIGNFLARQIYQSIAPMQGRERAQAIKSLAWMFGTYMMFSGLSGGAPWEPLKVVWMALGLLMPKQISGDWAAVENAIQAFAAKGLGAKGAEVLMRGLPRLLGIDLSNRISLGSLALFGSPKDQKTDSLKSWLFDFLTGAPTSMAMNSLNAIQKADFGSVSSGVNTLANIVPLPKMVRDITGGVAKAMEGTVGPSGKQYAPPLSPLEAVGKAAGFRPASEARQWETGGSGWETKQQKALVEARTNAAKPWFDADRSGGPAAREKAWQQIKEGWNKDHPEKPITKPQLDATKKRRATEAKKQAKTTEPAE